jgi:hypothetical protein
MDALGTYVVFTNKAGVDRGINVQNFHAEQMRNHLGRDFLYAAFGYSGATVDIQAANLEASLVFACDALWMNVAQQATDEGWLARIWTIWLDPDTFAETSNALSEVYAVTSYVNNLSEVVLNLSSPLDAQRAELPSRVLSRQIVGDLPPTGTIEFL